MQKPCKSPGSAPIIAFPGLSGSLESPAIFVSRIAHARVCEKEGRAFSRKADADHRISPVSGAISSGEAREHSHLSDSLAG